VTLTFFMFGAIASGSAFGVAAGTIGSAVGAGALHHRQIVWAALAMLGMLADLRLVPWLRVPTHRRQVPERWFRLYRGWVYGLGFGLELGAGFATVINSSLVYLTAAAALLAANPTRGFLIGVTFGIGRGAALLPTIRIRRSHDLMRMTALIHHFDLAARRGAAAVAGCTAAALLIAALI
jgi:hypothetical protein